MPQAIGMEKIRMYTGMLDNEFQPVLDSVRVRREEIRTKVRKEVMEELGIYKAMVEKVALKAKLSELDEFISRYTSKQGTYYDRQPSVVDVRVEEKMKDADGTYEQIVEAKKSLQKEIQMMVIPAEIREIFSKLPEILAGLTEAVKALSPVPKDEEFEKLEEAVGTDK